MSEWLDELWRDFVTLPALAQFLIIFGILCAICAGFATFLIARSFQADNYRGERRRGDARAVVDPPRPVAQHRLPAPDRAHPAFAIKWNGVSGAHRAIRSTIEGETRPLHPGHIASARARVGQLQDEAMTADRVRSIELERLKEPEEE